MIRPDKPRRYIADECGRHVLFGLTLSETREFEKLDDQLVAKVAGEQLRNVEANCASAGEKRWLELYVKHDSAWREWTATQSTGFRGYPAA